MLNSEFIELFRTEIGSTVYMVLLSSLISYLIGMPLGVILAGIALLLAALFRFVLSGEVLSRLGKLALSAMGFMRDGSINLFFPVLTFLLATALFSLGSYAVLRRTELRG